MRPHLLSYVHSVHSVHVKRLAVGVCPACLKSKAALTRRTPKASLLSAAQQQEQRQSLQRLDDLSPRCSIDNTPELRLY